MYRWIDPPHPFAQLGEVGVSVSRCANSEQKARDCMNNVNHSAGRGIFGDVLIVFLEYAKNFSWNYLIEFKSF